MSLYDYEISKELSYKDYPFYALIMAAMRKADDTNAELLRKAFPMVYEELHRRYHSPAGKLPHETEDLTAEDMEEIEQMQRDIIDPKS